MNVGQVERIARELDVSRLSALHEVGVLVSCNAKFQSMNMISPACIFSHSHSHASRGGKQQDKTYAQSPRLSPKTLESSGVPFVRIEVEKCKLFAFVVFHIMEHQMLKVECAARQDSQSASFQLFLEQTRFSTARR